MALSHHIKFVPAAAPIDAPVTKFGGQPHWVATPQWPLGRLTGKPMQFIAQIRLAPPLFAGTGGQMAYLFMSGDDEFVDSKWEPEGGENALIVQPGLYDGPSAPQATGPTLFRLVEKPGATHLEREPVEFGIETMPFEEAGFEDEQTRAGWTDAQYRRWAATSSAARRCSCRATSSRWARSGASPCSCTHPPCRSS